MQYSRQIFLGQYPSLFQRFSRDPQDALPPLTFRPFPCLYLSIFRAVIHRQNHFRLHPFMVYNPAAIIKSNTRKVQA